MEEYHVTRVETGVFGLDEMLGGGIPEKSIILLCGGPGSGKTIMTLQYMMAAVNRGEPVVYVSLEESMDKKMRNATAFGWDIAKAESEDMIDLGHLYGAS